LTGLGPRLACRGRLSALVSQVAGIRVWRKKPLAIFRKIGEMQTPVEKQPGTFRTGTNLKSPILHNKFQIAGSEAKLNHSRQFFAARSGKQKLISVRQTKADEAFGNHKFRFFAAAFLQAAGFR